MTHTPFNASVRIVLCDLLRKKRKLQNKASIIIIAKQKKHSTEKFGGLGAIQS